MTDSSKEAKQNGDKKENFIEKAEEIGEELLEKAQEFVKEDVEEKLGEFAKNKFIETIENLSFIQGILNSPCLNELIKKLGEKTKLVSQILGIVSVVAGGFGVFHIFGHRHVLTHELFFLVGGAATVVQGVGLLLAKKWTASIVGTNLALRLLFVLLILVIYQQWIFGSIGNVLWILVILFAVLIFVFKNKDLFDE